MFNKQAIILLVATILIITLILPGISSCREMEDTDITTTTADEVKSKEKSQSKGTKETINKSDSLRSVSVLPLWKVKDRYQESPMNFLFSSGGNVYFNEIQGHLSRINPLDGTKIWKSDKGSARCLKFTDKYIVDACEREVNVIDKIAGNTIKNCRLRDRTVFNLGISGDDLIMYYQSDVYRNGIHQGDHILAFDIMNEKVLWSKPIEKMGPKNRVGLIYRFKKIGDKLFVGATNSFLVLSSLTGNVIKWFDAEANCGFIFEPAVDNNDNFYAASSLFVLWNNLMYDWKPVIIDSYQRFYVFRFDKNLQQIWKKEIPPAISSPVISENKLFLLTIEPKDLKPPLPEFARPVLNCFDKNTGEKLWDYRFMRGEVYFEQLMERNYIHCYDGLVMYCHGFDGVHIFDAKTGKLLKKITLAPTKFPVALTPFSFPHYTAAYDKGTIYLFGYFREENLEDCTKTREEEILAAFRVKKDK